MSLIQPVLVLLFLGLVVLYWMRFRTRSLDRLIVLAVSVVAIALIASPELSTRAAQLLGVGRGTDLVMYLGLTGTAFLMVLLLSRVRALQDQLGHLVREIALRDAFDARGEGPERKTDDDVS